VRIGRKARQIEVAIVFAVVCHAFVQLILFIHRVSLRWFDAVVMWELGPQMFSACPQQLTALYGV